MVEINTTSINDLPSNSLEENINLGAIQPQQQNSQLSLDQITISQIVNGIQQASLVGATKLQSRDIPLQTEQLTNDEQIQANYIQPSQINNYITDDNDDIKKYYIAAKSKDSLDNLYDELQSPLLLAVLYFLFQLPFFKKNIFKYLPFFCNKDGNYNFNGLIFTCLFFGFVYYSLSNVVKKFSKF